MNASQRRKIRRQTIRAFPIGTSVECWYTGYDDYKVEGYKHGKYSVVIKSHFGNSRITAKPKDLRIKHDH